MVSENEKGTQFMLVVFSESVVLRTKVPFNKNEVIALYVQFASQFGLIDVTLHLRSPLVSPLQSFLCNFRPHYVGTGNVHDSSMLLVINMVVATSPPNIRNCCVIMYCTYISTPIIITCLTWLIYLHHKSHSSVDWARWRQNTTAWRGPAPKSCIGPRTRWGRPWLSRTASWCFLD